MAEIETLRPVFVIAPYLPLGAVHAIGPWRLVPRDAADVRWVDRWVREHVEPFSHTSLTFTVAQSSIPLSSTAPVSR
jgi:hypothetical protein